MYFKRTVDGLILYVFIKKAILKSFSTIAHLSKLINPGMNINNVKKCEIFNLKAINKILRIKLYEATRKILGG